MTLSKFQRDKCLHLIEKFLSWDICAPFRDNVDPVKDGATDYFEVIKEPMSLNEIKRKLNANMYSDIKSFSYDVNLIWNNARQYNREDTVFAMMAKEAQTYFAKKMKTFPSTVEEEWLMKLKKVANEFNEALLHPPHDLYPKAAQATLPKIEPIDISMF